MNNTVDLFKGRLDIVEEKNSDLEATALETVQNETGKGITKNFKISVICGTSSSHLISMYLESLKEEREEKKIFEDIMVKNFQIWWKL